VRRLLASLARPRHYPWIALALALLVLLPRLGSYGFWEPREIAVADAASKWIERSQSDGTKKKPPVEEEDSEPDEDEPPAVPAEPAAKQQTSAEPGMSAEPGSPVEEVVKKPPAKDRKRPATKAAQEPRFTERLVAAGVERAGYTELGARWPLALLGLIAVMAAYVLGARLGSPRAGLVGALVLLSFPLLTLQSRQLTSEIAGVSGSTLLFVGLTGLALPRRWTRLFGARGSDLVPATLLVIDVLAVVAGVILSSRAAGALLGVAPPLVGFGVGALAWLATDRTAEQRAGRATLVVGALALLGAGVSLLWFMHGTFSWVEAGEGDRHLFGWTLEATREPLAALGAPWKDAGDVQTPFSVLFEQLGFGLFPWIAVAPIALGRFAFGRDERDERAGAEGASWGGAVLFAWAAAAWIAGAVVTRKVGPVMYPAAAAVAVAIGMWIDDLLAQREREPDGGESGSLPLVALFVFCAAVVLAKDLAMSPEEFTSLTSGGTVVKMPDGSKLHHGLVACGGLVGLAAGSALFFWRGPYRLALGGGRDLFDLVGRWGLHVAVALGVVFALFVSQVWVPGLAARMSSRDVLAVYRELRQEGDRLGIVGNLGSGPAYYSGGDYQKLEGRKELIDFLKRPERVFALMRAAERCPMHKEASKKNFEYHVLDDDNVQFLLLSNQLRAGERDLNELPELVLREPPADLGRKVSVMFEDEVELVGVKMPSSPSHDDKFEITFVYKVLKPIGKSWKVFVHIDGPGGHISGDHQPLGGLCGFTSFRAGDYLVDRFTVDPEGRTPGKYRVHTGLFTGSAGNFTNMKVTAGNPDKDNRAPLGEITLR
jgi:4-amino-4-deoxy-L-arabinose transferase-like glycosyltransferase